MSTGHEDREADQFSVAFEWSHHFDKSIRMESTRAKVVLSACYLEELLRQLIEMVLIPVDNSEDSLLDGPEAPLGSMSSRINLAWRMGLIPEDTRASLHLVRKIRNQFAHSLATCDFNDPKICNWNSELDGLRKRPSAERRAAFADGPEGDFEASVSWLVFWLKHIMQTIPSTCPKCGGEMDHRVRIKAAPPAERI